MDPSKYEVEFSDFSQRHYIKDFFKKYKSNWSKTKTDITNICSRIDRMLAAGRQQVDLIRADGNYKLLKLDFAIEGIKQSPKTSGNRAILWLDESKRKVTILLVYGKGHVKGKHETVWWQKMVRENFDSVKDWYGS